MKVDCTVRFFNSRSRLKLNEVAVTLSVRLSVCLCLTHSRRRRLSCLGTFTLSHSLTHPRPRPRPHTHYPPQINGGIAKYRFMKYSVHTFVPGTVLAAFHNITISNVHRGLILWIIVLSTNGLYQVLYISVFHNINVPEIRNSAAFC